MKRRRKISESNPKNPSPTRKISLTGGFHGVWSSNSRFQPTVTPENEDISEAKRNFTIPETDHHPNARPVASVFPNEVTQAPKSDGPKTSEYAFFKKLKKDAGRTFHPYSLHKEGDQTEKPESSEYNGDVTNKVRRSFKDLKSSSLVEKVTPINLDSFPSPYLGDPGPSKSLVHAENTKIIKDKLKNHKSSVLIEKDVPVNFDSFPSLFEGPAKSSVSGTQNWPDDIFSTKRQRLRQWVADTSSLGIDELHSKGYNLVSVLLNRLFPESNENNCLEFEDSKLKRGDIDTEYEPLVFPDSVADFRKSRWTAFSELVEPEHMLYKDDSSLACWSNNSRRDIFSKWDTVGCDSPASHANKTHFQDMIKDIDFELDGGRTANLCAETDSAFSFRFDSPASNPQMGLDEYLGPNKPALGRKPHTFLLDWNFDSIRDEHSLSCASRSTELSLYSTLSTSLSNSYWHKSDNMSDASEWCLPPFLSNYARNFTSPLHLPSASYCNLDFERHVFEDKKDLDAALNRFPLTLSFTPNYVDLAEDCRCETSYEGFNNFPSPQNHPLLMGKVSSDKYLPALEALHIPSGLDYGLEQKWFSITDSFSKHHSSTFHALEFPQEESRALYSSPEDEYKGCLDGSSQGETLNQIANDEFNIYDRSSTGFQISLIEEKAFPLLLDQQSWDGSEGDTNSDDTDTKHIQCLPHIFGTSSML